MCDHRESPPQTFEEQVVGECNTLTLTCYSKKVLIPLTEFKV